MASFLSLCLLATAAIAAPLQQQPFVLSDSLSEIELATTTDLSSCLNSLSTAAAASERPSLQSCIASLLPSSSPLLPHLSPSPLASELRTIAYTLPASPSTIRTATVAEDEVPWLRLVGLERFRDVTGLPATATEMAAGEGKPFPEKLRYSKEQLKGFFDRLDVGEMKEFLSKFTSFRTRYYRSTTGRESQAFLLEHIRKIASLNKDKDRVNITVEEVPHSWGQSSIIARAHLSPSSSASPSSDDEEIIIIGAHQDSTNMIPFLPAPGADDDGSGTTTVLTAFKSLVLGGFSVPSLSGGSETNEQKKVVVEFHWYSAEEGGLLGSKAVSELYKERGWSGRVRSMVQMDMTAWVKKGTREQIGIIDDYVDPTLTQFLRELVTAYATIPYVETQCGYACSDHASWSAVGVRSGFIIESTFDDHNPNIHSGKDTIDHDEFSFEHMREFGRVVVGYVLELIAD